MTHASAPGKIILFGEHAVVYGQPALAVPVNQVHADAEVFDADRAGIWVNAPDIRLHAEHSRLALDDALAATISMVCSALSIDFSRRVLPTEAISAGGSWCFLP